MELPKHLHPGTALVNLQTEPLGTDSAGKKVYLCDIWPSRAEIDEAVSKCITPTMFKDRYDDVFDGNSQSSRQVGADETIVPVILRRVQKAVGVHGDELRIDGKPTGDIDPSPQPWRFTL